MEEPSFWFIVGLSFIGTLLCWYRIFRSRAPWGWKVAGVLIAAIPLGGPFFFLILDMPSRIPEGAQAKLGWRTGGTPYTEIRRELFEGNRRHIASMFGKRIIDGKSPNREDRRAAARTAPKK